MGTPNDLSGPLEEEAWNPQISTTEPSEEGEIRCVTGKGWMHFSDGVARAIGEGRAAIHQYPVDEHGVDTPPGSPTTGYRVIVGDSPTGDFVGHAGEIAQYDGSAWVFIAPQEGTESYAKAQGNIYRQTASSAPWAWQAGPTPNFGAWYDDEEVAGPLSTSGSAWLEAIRLDFPVDLELGDYIIMCALFAYGSSSSTQVGLRQRFDTTTICEVTVQATGTAVEVPLAGYHVQKSISGSHSYTIEFNKTGGSGTAYVKNLVIISFRVG